MKKWEFKKFIYKNTGIEISRFHRFGFLKFTYPPTRRYFISSLTYKDILTFKKKTLLAIKKDLIKMLITTRTA